MNMAIRGIDFNFGSKNVPIPRWTTSTRICELTFVMANLPFNMKGVVNAKLEKRRALEIRA